MTRRRRTESHPHTECFSNTDIKQPPAHTCGDVTILTPRFCVWDSGMCGMQAEYREKKHNMDVVSCKRNT